MAVVLTGAPAERPYVSELAGQVRGEPAGCSTSPAN